MTAKAGIAVSFDPKTFKIVHRMKAEDDADGIIFDKMSGDIFVIDGDSGKLTRVNPKTDKPIATIDGAGGLEFGVSGENGKLYVDGAEKNEIVRVDVKSNTADAHWPLTGCTRPHGLAIDTKTKRLFASCSNKVMAVMDAETGTVLANVAIGDGTDFAMFDAKTNLAFSSNRDGTLSIVEEKSPGEFRGARACPNRFRRAHHGPQSQDRAHLSGDGGFRRESVGHRRPPPLHDQAGHGEAVVPRSRQAVRPTWSSC